VSNKQQFYFMFLFYKDTLMKKLNLLNSLVFVLASQSSINIISSETDTNSSIAKKYLTKKNVAIAAVAVVATYELAKVYQAFVAKPELKKPISEIADYAKTMAKEIIELNKKDLNKVTSAIKSLGSTIKTKGSLYGNSALGYLKTPFVYAQNKRLELIQKAQLQDTTRKFNNLAEGTSKVAELKSNLIDVLDSNI